VLTEPQYQNAVVWLVAFVLGVAPGLALLMDVGGIARRLARSFEGVPMFGWGWWDHASSWRALGLMLIGFAVIGSIGYYFR
jgi:hypothetical protein